MSLLKNFATVGGATLASRVLGFVRDAMLAATVGTGPVADAFVVAFRLPNLFRRLFAEGAFNSAFVPLFARSVEEDGREASRQIAGEVAAALFWTLIVVSALAMIAMPAIVLVLAPGFLSHPEKFDLTVLMSRIAFPYLMLMSLMAFVAGILNTFQRFAAAAFAPLLLNIVMCLVLVGIVSLHVTGDDKIGILLTSGVVVAGVLQLAFVLFDMKRAGFSVPLLRPHYTPAVRRLLILGLPGVIAGGITQINIVVGQIIASMQPSANALLYYADRLYQLPLGVIGIAIGVVLLPNLTRQLRSGNGALYQRTFNNSLEFALALTLPATVALIIIPSEIVSVLFQRGAFDAADVQGTSAALVAFSFGLPAFVMNKVFSPGYFAREDTKTPMWFAGVGMVVNVVLSLILFPVWHHVGIAIATSVAGWVNSLLLAFVLWRRGHFIPDGRVLRRIVLLLVASLLMGVVVYFGAEFLKPWLHAPRLVVRFFSLCLLVFVGMAGFAIFVQLTGASDLLGRLKTLMRRDAA